MPNWHSKYMEELNKTNKSKYWTCTYTQHSHHSLINSVTQVFHDLENASSPGISWSSVCTWLMRCLNSLTITQVRHFKWSSSPWGIKISIFPYSSCTKGQPRTPTSIIQTIILFIVFLDSRIDLFLTLEKGTKDNFQNDTYLIQQV